jgi:hypothetical protein
VVSKDTADGITVDYRLVGSKGLVVLTARYPDGEPFTDKIDILDAKARKRFALHACKRCGGVKAADVLARLDTVAGEVTSGVAEADQDEGNKSQSDVLIGLVTDTADIELFHNPSSDAFASVVVNGGQRLGGRGIPHRALPCRTDRIQRRNLGGHGWRTADGTERAARAGPSSPRLA